MRRRSEERFTYLLHLVLVKPEHIDQLPDNRGWIPNGYRAIAGIAIRLDYTGPTILGQRLDELNHKRLIQLITRLGAFDRALDRLPLDQLERSWAEWTTEPGIYFYRNTWLRGHWQWLRILEENPGLPTLTLSLSDLLAAYQERVARVAQAAAGHSASATGLSH